MIENPLAKKLRIKEHQKILALNAPPGFDSQLKPLPMDTKLFTDKSTSDQVYDLVLLFTVNSKELELFGGHAIKSVKKDGILWIAYPKLSSGIKSDLTRDKGWSFLDSYSLTGISNIAVDETWSAIRFKYADDGISHDQKMAGYQNRDKSPESRAVVVPPDFQLALNLNPKAQMIFDKFAYTHRKEYVRWIEEAKKQETRDNRIQKAVERIEQGTKFS